MLGHVRHATVRGMAFRWRYLDEAGDEITEFAGPESLRPAEPFPSQDEAEAWFTDVWRELLEHGVHAVTLLKRQDNTESVVYGPMSLHEAT